MRVSRFTRGALCSER